jgi:hypothetical protein
MRVLQQETVAMCTCRTRVDLAVPYKYAIDKDVMCRHTITETRYGVTTVNEAQMFPVNIRQALRGARIR